MARSTRSNLSPSPQSASNCLPAASRRSSHARRRSAMALRRSSLRAAEAASQASACAVWPTARSRPASDRARWSKCCQATRSKADAAGATP
eukprot:11147981-Alexandrium_andersonii.AAC.1